MKRFAAPVVIAAGLALPLLLGADGTPAGKRGVLEVISQGYSRFEIEDGNVVANYPEPVVFRYLGYEVHADTLRFNQATSVAEASGKIQLDSKDISLNCDAVTLDGAKGVATASGGVTAESDSLGAGFSAQEAQISFPAGQYSPDLADISIEVRGGISLADLKGNKLQADSATLDGSTRNLVIPGAVRAELVMPSRKSAQPVLIDAGQKLEVSCEQATAHLTEEQGIDTFSGSAVDAVATDLQFSAAQVSFDLQAPGDANASHWRAKASGLPLSLSAKQKGKPFNAISNSAEITFGEKGVEKASLAGSAVVWSGQFALRSEVIDLQSTKDGYKASVAQGLTINSDMAAVSGMAPINLQHQLQQRGH